MDYNKSRYRDNIPSRQLPVLINAVFYNAGTTVVLGNASSPHTNEELFTFEAVAGSNLVNIKSVSDNKYFVLQYGLDGPGNLIHRGFGTVIKLSPVPLNFPALIPCLLQPAVNIILNW